ncbi:uncharacterized protein LOC144874394 [Branchiostoma floridae x Branchiostoma japonicum]
MIAKRAHILGWGLLLFLSLLCASSGTCVFPSNLEGDWLFYSHPSGAIGMADATVEGANITVSTSGLTMYLVCEETEADLYLLKQVVDAVGQPPNTGYRCAEIVDVDAANFYYIKIVRGLGSDPTLSCTSGGSELSITFGFVAKSPVPVAFPVLGQGTATYSVNGEVCFNPVSSYDGCLNGSTAFGLYPQNCSNLGILQPEMGRQFEYIANWTEDGTDRKLLLARDNNPDTGGSDKSIHQCFVYAVDPDTGDAFVSLARNPRWLCKDEQREASSDSQNIEMALSMTRDAPCAGHHSTASVVAVLLTTVLMYLVLN